MKDRQTADNHDPVTEGLEEKPIVTIRNVIWRKVERGGNQNKLGRPSVHLPLEAVDILDLRDRGDMVAFMMKKKTKEIMLTNYYGSQPANIAKTESDPEVLIGRLLAQVLVLKSRKAEISEKWDNDEIDNQEFITTYKDAQRQEKAITENVKKILTGSFRGPPDVNSFMQSKLKSFYNEYASTFVSYVEDLAAKIESLQRSIDILESARSKGLFNDYEEYLYEKEELKFQLNTFRSLANGAVDLLSKYK